MITTSLSRSVGWHMIFILLHCIQTGGKQRYFSLLDSRKIIDINSFFFQDNMVDWIFLPLLLNDANHLLTLVRFAVVIVFCGKDYKLWDRLDSFLQDDNSWLYGWKVLIIAIIVVLIVVIMIIAAIIVNNRTYISLNMYE